jgi:hypothetical protein
MALEKLDEKGFVFIDGNNRPYWCRMYYGKPVWMRWNEGTKSWITYREITQSEVWQSELMKIPDEQANIYHEKHDKFING